MKKTILICGDDLNTVSLLMQSCRQDNCKVLSEHDWAEVVNRVIEYKPVLTILVFDTQVNFKLCRELKKNTRNIKTGIIIIGMEQEDKHDMISGLHIGVEDYVIKPFDIDVFIAKAKAIMRRIDLRKEPDEVVRHGSLEINLTTHKAFISRKEIGLTPKELALLYYLVIRKGKVLSREFIMEHIWEQEYLGDPRTINKHIETLRKKIGALAGSIETIQSAGYRFTE